MQRLLKLLSKRSVGADKERLAEQFLKQQGATLLARNFSSRGGEIDLIVQHLDYLVFVEVRYRSSAGFGGAAASISRTKQHRIITTAQHYLQNNKQWQHAPCRFDVVAIEGEDINWLQDAFQLSP